MKTEYLVMLSEIIDKMGIADELKSLEINTGNEKKDKRYRHAYCIPLTLGSHRLRILVRRKYMHEIKALSYFSHE